MNATELRIGNLVDIINRSNKVHLPCNVIKIVGSVGLFRADLYDITKSISQQDEYLDESLVDVCGITLTEEWLKKLGFERIQGWYFYEHSHWIAIELYPDGDFALRIREHQVNIYQHVHTVQNIFHSLTGTELTLKP